MIQKFTSLNVVRKYRLMQIRNKDFVQRIIHKEFNKIHIHEK